MREPGIEDATRRTRLANERTYLAWWRTGLTSLAVAVGIGRIAPEVSHVRRWPYELAGTGLAVLGVAFIIIGFLRTLAIERALDRGSFVPLGVRLPLVMLVAGLAIGITTILILVLAR